MKVTVWNEYLHEKNDDKVKAVYPNGIHTAIKEFLDKAGYDTKTAVLEQEEHGLTDEVLENTDVLLWWGHMAHDKVEDSIVEKVYNRVLEGMGLIVLHSGHYSKIFRKLMGTTCSLRWREADECEYLWVIEPSHPIAEGIGDYVYLEKEEMYGERFDIPAPDELVFAGWFKGGEIFRSGCCYHRGHGKIFYFQPGHESYPIYYNKDIQKIIINAINWAKTNNKRETLGCYHIVEPMQEV